MGTINIFEYLDYRKYLDDYYNDCKQSDPDCSFRRFGKMLGFASPNYLRLIINGVKNLGDESIHMISTSLSLKKKEAEYFYNLVRFNQEKDLKKKNALFVNLSAYRGRSVVMELTSDQYDYFNQWFNPVVREMVRGLKMPLDYDGIGARIIPSISGSKVKKSVELLLKMGFINIDEKGIYEQSVPVMNTANEAMSLAVKNYHSAVLSLAGRAVFEIDPLQREISAVTAKISEGGLKKLKERIQSFRTELLDIISEDTEVDRIYQLNFQLYPVSIPDEKNNK